MIHSSIFSFDGSSVWDPNVVRKYLYISEDQLNILSNISGWSKVSDHANTLRLEEETTIIQDSLSSQLNVPVATQNLQKNIKLFDHNLLVEGIALKQQKVQAKKFTRSVSLCEINKVSENLPNNKSLKRTLSLPALCQSDSKTTLPKKYSLYTRKGLPTQKLSEVILDQKDISASKSIRLTEATLEVMEVVSQLPANISGPVEKVSNELNIDMIGRNDTMSAVHATNPDSRNEKAANVLHDLENVSNSETRVHPEKNVNLMCDAQVIENAHNFGSQLKNISNDIEKVITSGATTIYVNPKNTENSSNLVDPSTAIISNILFVGEVKSAVYKEHKDNLVDSEPSENKLGSCIVLETVPVDDSSGIDIATDKMNSNSEKITEISETPREKIESLKSVPKEQTLLVNNSVSFNQKHPNLEKLIDSESSEDKLGSCIIKETIPADINLSNNASNTNMNINSEKLTEISETPIEDLKSSTCAPKEQPKIEGNSNLQNTRMKALNDQNISQEISVVTNKCATENRAVPEKRKLDLKIKSSKRRKTNREKSESVEVRSIKRAGEIHYSDDDFKAMINIMKCFL